MTDEQKAAYIIAQSAGALITAYSYLVANMAAAAAGRPLPYEEKHFTDLVLSEGIGHNAVIGFFTGR